MAKGRRSKDSEDTQVELLRAIWGEMKGLNARVDRTNERLDQTNERLDQTNERLEQMSGRLDQGNERLDQTVERLGALERHQTHTEVRLASEIVAVAKAVNEVRDLLREHAVLAPRVDDHERRLSTIERKLA